MNSDAVEAARQAVIEASYIGQISTLFIDDELDAFAAAVRAEAVAAERRRIADELVPQLLMDAEGGDDDPIDHACNLGIRLAISLIYAVCEVPLMNRVDLFPASGSVPVATPEPTVEIGGVVMTQAQFNAARYPLLSHPPAEPTAERQLLVALGELCDELMGKPLGSIEHVIGARLDYLLSAGSVPVAAPEPVDEWKCPECGATTRARMADKVAAPAEGER